MYKELINGAFVPQDISYPTLMKKHVKKHSSYLQPIFEAISNSLEATSGKDDIITIRINKAKTLNQEQYSFLSIDIIDTGIGFNDDNFGRLRRLYDESKGQNNFGTGRVQYLHFFNNTDIYSVFEEEGLKYKRRIVLSKNFYATQKSVIWSSEKEVVDIDTPIGTMVSFYYPLSDEDKEKYNELTTTELRDRILIHYLSRFCLNRDNLQQIKLEYYINSICDKDSVQVITGKDIPQPDYTDSVQVNYSKISVDGNTIIKTPNTEEFIINSYSLPCSIQKRNEVKLTSKNETVEVSGIDFSIIKDSPKINNSYLLFLISSSYLTQQDSDLRGQLAIYSKKDFLKKRNLFSGEEQILTDDIEEKVTSSITTHYKSISKVKESFESQIDELAEMFSLDRRILNEVGYKAGDSDQSILKKVYEYNADISAKHDAGIKSVMDSLKELTPSSKDFKKKLNEKVKKVTELVPQINRTELVRYISKSEVVLQAGQKVPDGNGNWKEIIGKADSYDDNNRLITSINGPMESNEIRINKTGFFFRKFLDETIGASTNSKMSTMWYPRFRISEAYMIACEAAYELNKTGEDDPLNYINPVRTRAGISELESITFEDIVREYRVEFALEDHRYWDLKRWRLAHEIWDGNSENPDAQLYELFPYQVNDPGSANDKMWVFDKKKAYMVPYPRYFQMKNYYNFFDNSWLNKNPLLVKNPYQ